MKRYFKIILVLTLLFNLGCGDDYLETIPTDAVAAASVFTTTKNANTALNGIHRMLYERFDSQGQPAEAGIMIMSEAMAEDLVMTATANSWFISMARWLVHIDENASDVKFAWRYYYKVIGNANMIIANIDAADGPQSEKDMVKGQALAYRAWAHFKLVQLFAKRYEIGSGNTQLGVPIVLEPIVEGGPRNTVEEVYAQANKDIDEAITLLEPSRASKSDLNSNVAKGIKARIALVQGDYNTAAQMAKEAREGFSLMSADQLYEGFNNVDNPEWIWGSKQIDDQQIYFASFFAYMSINFSSTNIRGNPKAINSLLYDKISETDARKGLWDPTGKKFEVPSNFAKKPYMNRKFIAQGPSSSVGDVPYMRVAEMILTEAEALAKLGKDSEAAKVLFELASSRDPEYVLSTNTGNDLIEEIYIQRRIELWGEGFRFFDLKRLNMPLDRTGANHVASVINSKFEEPAGTNNWQWKIPRAELNANDKIEQNPQ